MALTGISLIRIFAVVKYIALILSFYVLFLSGMPCCIDDNCADDKVSTEHSQQQNKTDEGNCSPFFSCSTCSGFIFQEMQVTVAPVLVLMNDSYPDVKQDFCTQVCSTIWQPPKIG